MWCGLDPNTAIGAVGLAAPPESRPGVGAATSRKRHLPPAGGVKVAFTLPARTGTLAIVL